MREYYNALLACYYFRSMVYEVCNADDALNDRKHITLQDCILAAKMGDYWYRYALEDCV